MTEDKNWKCNGCGHGADNRPDRVCTCNCHEVWDAAIEAAAKIAGHPYRIGQVDGQTKPTETGEAIAVEIRALGEKRDDRG